MDHEISIQADESPKSRPSIEDFGLISEESEYPPTERKIIKGRPIWINFEVDTFHFIWAPHTAMRMESKTDIGDILMDFMRTVDMFNFPSEVLERIKHVSTKQLWAA